MKNCESKYKALAKISDMQEQQIKELRQDAITKSRIYEENLSGKRRQIKELEGKLDSMIKQSNKGTKSNRNPYK